MYYPTSFAMVYDSFLSKITDDMYLQLTKQQTQALLKQLLITAVHKFQFPRVALDYQYMDQNECKKCAKYEICRKASQEDEGWVFMHPLSQEEINILSTYMIVEWLGQQLASIENVRMKYSGADFKFTSQANHMQKVLQMKKDYEREGFHLQRLYKRRIKDIYGRYHTTMPTIMDPLEDFTPEERKNCDGHCCEYYEAIIWHNFNDFDQQVSEEQGCDCGDDDGGA